MFITELSDQVVKPLHDQQSSRPCSVPTTSAAFRMPPFSPELPRTLPLRPPLTLVSKPLIWHCLAWSCSHPHQPIILSNSRAFFQSDHKFGRLSKDLLAAWGPPVLKYVLVRQQVQRIFRYTKIRTVLQWYFPTEKLLVVVQTLQKALILNLF